MSEKRITVREDIFNRLKEYKLECEPWGYFLEKVIELIEKDIAEGEK